MFTNYRKIPSILIVDDVPSNLQLIYEAVKGCGNIYFASDGESALQKAIECEPDVVLLDIEMPDIDGYEVLERMRNIPELSEVAVIFVTGHDDSIHELKTLEAGGVDFIHKPINLAVTRARVKTQLTIRSQKDKIKNSANDLALLVQNLPAFISYWDGDGKNIFSNDSEGVWFGITPTDMHGLKVTEVFEKSSHQKVQSEISKAFHGEKSVVDVICTSKSGEEVHGQLTVVPRSKFDRANGFMILITDITARKEAELALYDEKERIRITLNSIGDAVIATDTSGNVTFMNPIAESMTGNSQEQAIGKPIEDIMPLIEIGSGQILTNPVRIALREERIVGMALNCGLQNNSDFYTEVEDSAAPIRNQNGDITGAIIVFHDVSEARAMAVKMTHLAQHDPITNLPNRLLLTDRIQQSIKQANDSFKKVALVIFDIDDFKSVNETVGHDGGDLLLRDIAAKIQQNLCSNETLYRHGGDEFILLLSDLTSTIKVMRSVSKLINTFNQTWKVKNYKFQLDICVGISIYQDDSLNSDELYHHAETALFTAKQSSKKKVQFYSQDIEQKLQLKYELENSLKEAHGKNRFEVFYQPKININGRKIVGAEALVRWRDKEGNLIPPNDFIPLAEETGLIIPLGELVLFKACKQAALWNESGFNLQIAVNVSLVQFEDKNFLRSLKQALKVARLDPRNLELELTESVLAKDMDYARSLIHEIRELGVSVSLDDFGTGYSSLSYIKDFHLDVLKIDQSFVKDMFMSTSNQTIIAAIIQMAKGLNLKVIAEGVETEQHAEKLQKMGCTVMQGYLFSKPIPADEMSQMIEDLNTGVGSELAGNQIATD